MTKHRFTGIALSIVLAACGGGSGDDGDDDTPAIDAPTDSPSQPAGPSTDPLAPTPITAGQTVSATYTAGIEGHFFVFTAPAAGVFTASFTGPVFGQVNHCADTAGCFCVIGPGANCCQLQEGETECSYDIELVSGEPLAAGDVVYPSIYMRPGVTGPYTVRIDGPS